MPTTNGLGLEKKDGWLRRNHDEWGPAGYNEGKSDNQGGHGMALLKSFSIGLRNRGPGEEDSGPAMGRK